jgi:hypothetical protein
MSGFYGWKKMPRGKVLHYARLLNRDLFTCADLWAWLLDCGGALHEQN